MSFSLIRSDVTTSDYKNYTDNIFSSGPLNIASVRAGSGSNLSLTAGYQGSTPLTNSFYFTNITFDSTVTLVADDRILLYNQTDKTQNGIWVVKSVVVSGSTYVNIQRPDDYAYGSIMRTGTRVVVLAGNTLAGKVFENVTSQFDINSNRIINYVGTSNQIWAQLVGNSALTADANGNVNCYSHLRLDDWYRWLYFSGGNNKLVIGGDYAQNGDGVSFGYNWNPSNVKLGFWHATRMFIGYNTIWFEYSPKNSDNSGRFVTFIAEGEYNRNRSINLYPIGDSTHSIGSGSYRWSQVYAVNAAISTSDEREKCNITPLQPDEALSLLMKLHPVFYKWKGSLSTSNRFHSGFIAQQVERDLGSEASSNWGFFIHSPAWVESKDNGTEEAKTEIYHEDKYGLRYEELISPLVGSVQALCNRVQTLETQQCPKCVELQTKVDALEARLAQLESRMLALESR